MERLEHYRCSIKKILTGYHEWVSGSSHLGRESCLVFDEDHDHYLWIFM
ncbi:element excision factor XisI family protein, partial [Roseofilum sp. Guam]|nr:XisI protein [Roseofilum sp. Guam]